MAWIEGRVVMYNYWFSVNQLLLQLLSSKSTFPICELYTATTAGQGTITCSFFFLSNLLTSDLGSSPTKEERKETLLLSCTEQWKYQLTWDSLWILPNNHEIPFLVFFVFELAVGNSIALNCTYALNSLAEQISS